MSWKMKAAFATDDGVHFIKRHFGDAKKFVIYEITQHGTTLIKQIDNTVDVEEKQHADPKKAGGITGLLSKEGVNTAVALAFGPNIVRVRKKFVCMKIDSKSIEEVLPLIIKNYEKIQKVWEEGEDRKHLVLSEKSNAEA